MRFFQTLSALSLAYLSNAIPVAEYPTYETSKGYSMGIFYVNWAIYGRQHFVTDLPADKLTKVSYAFANVNNETGEVFLSDEWADLQYSYPGDTAAAANETKLLGNFNQLFKLKQENRNLKVVLSVGGWSYRENFKNALATEERRTKFAETALTLMTDLGLDGFDIDWEYPETEEDGANLIATVQLCRSMFDEYAAEHADGYHFSLDISAPAGPLRYNAMPVAEMDPYVDQWKLMAFDYQGPGFSNFTGHLSNVNPDKNTPLASDFNTVQAVDFYKANIASPSKLILGMPAYGRSFANVPNINNGLGQIFNGSGVGTWEAGVQDYKAIQLNATTVHTDTDVVASWGYNNVTKEFVSFDTPEVQVLKAKYLMDEELGGPWWWDSSTDRTDDMSLVSNVSPSSSSPPSPAITVKYMY